MDRTERINAARVMSGDGPWERRPRGSRSVWIPDLDPSWDCDAYEYREAPKPPPAPVLRPWTADEVPVGSVVRRKGYPHLRTMIVAVNQTAGGEVCVEIGNNANQWSAKRLSEDWTREDGTPCGVMVVPMVMPGVETYTGDHT
jgi:hypothetical protein